MVQNSSKNLGDSGEKRARALLESKGYCILETNWRFKKLEVDIIAKKDDQIVIVEVKTRKNSTFGDPEIFVTRKKQNFLITAAHHYLVDNNIDLPARFDVISVLPENGSYSVKHLEGAFYPLIKS